MIIVTGTKRSGTSMWMQALKAGGFPVLGQAFLGNWDKSIKAANPRGFYESPYRQGIFYGTNPNPKTGEYLRPQDTRRHAVKVFIPGTIRTDIAYMDKVIATMRPWQVYSRSIRKLYALEDAHHETLTGEARAKALRSVQIGRPKIPPDVEWWLEHYELIRDFATRRYPIHLTSYERVLDNPEREFGKVFKWLGGGDVQAAAAEVDGKLHRSNTDDPVESALDGEKVAIMDEIYERIHAEKGLTSELITALNTHQDEIVKRFGAPSRERMREDLAEGGDTPA